MPLYLNPDSLFLSPISTSYSYMMFSSATTTRDPYSNTMPIAPLLTTKWNYNNINETAPNCPRCASSNTKFCYYNNYSFSQPRYFCKACRRYWTKGGSLRNVPVGGGCRKSRRSRAANRQAGGPNTAASSGAAASAEGSNSGSCIDMAAVFAKYVNQKVDSDESVSTGSSSDNGQQSCTLEDINTVFECEKPLDDLMTMDQVSTCNDVISSQQFVYPDCNGGFELQQGVLCDEEILWSEGTTPLVQVEDCGLFVPDNDQLRISENFVTDDDWASFDLIAYDFYSTP